MEPSPAARPQPLRVLPHDEQAQDDRQTTDNASSEPCYIDDVSATVAEKVTATTVVDRLMETTTDIHENNSTAMRAADENNLTTVTAADEEVTAVAVPATLQVTTDEKAVTTTARASEVSFVREFKRYLIFFISTLHLIRRHSRILCYLCLRNGLHEIL